MYIDKYKHTYTHAESSRYKTFISTNLRESHRVIKRASLGNQKGLVLPLPLVYMLTMSSTAYTADTNIEYFCLEKYTP